MPDAILGLISSKAALTLISVVVGALIPIVPNLIESKRQERREAIKLAAEAAWKDERPLSATSGHPNCRFHVP